MKSPSQLYLVYKWTFYRLYFFLKTFWCKRVEPWRRIFQHRVLQVGSWFSSPWWTCWLQPVNLAVCFFCVNLDAGFHWWQDSSINATISGSQDTSRWRPGTKHWWDGSVCSMSPGTQYILLTTLWLSPDPICYCSIYLQYLSSILYDSYNSACILYFECFLLLIISLFSFSDVFPYYLLSNWLHLPLLPLWVFLLFYCILFHFLHFIYFFHFCPTKYLICNTWLLTRLALCGYFRWPVPYFSSYSYSFYMIQIKQN